MPDPDRFASSRHSDRRDPDLPEELYDMPGHAPGNLPFLLGQIVERLKAMDDNMDGFRDTAIAVQEGQSKIEAALVAIQHVQEDHSKKLTRVDTAITMAGITNAAGKAVPFLGIGSVIATAAYWLRNHLHWGQ